MAAKSKDVMPGAAGTTLQLGGRALPLRFTVKAVKKIQAEYKINVLHDLGALLAMENLDVERLAFCVWAGALAVEPELTLEEVEAELDFLNLPAAAEAIVLAFGMALPEAEGDAGSSDTGK